MVDSSFADMKASGLDEGESPAVPLAPEADEQFLSGDPAVVDKAPGDKGDIIQPGRSLVHADFVPPHLGPGEKLVRLAYRLGIPASMLTSPVGRKPKTRLLATVSSPIAGNRPSGMAIRAGHFLVHGAKTPIAQIDFNGAARMPPPLESTVHSFSWLADLNACGPREQCAPVAERILSAWMQVNAKPPSKPKKAAAWTVGHTGNRLLNWLVYAPLILSGIDKSLRSRVLVSIAEQARWLDRNVHRAEDGLAEASGWCAIIAAGLLLPDGKPRRLYGEAGLIRALGELVGDDGGVLSRSPLAQIEAITLLVQLCACYRATRRDPPEAADAMLGALVPPLLALTHGDGSLGSWQGSWGMDADEIAVLVEASGVRTRPLRDVRQWGYQRIVAQKGVLLFDVSPPPMPKHSRHGCASTLAFELSSNGQRIVVNCGGSASAGGLVPVRLEQGLRATAAHSTLALDDTNSTAVLINGQIGSGVSEVDVDRRTVELENGNATRIEASHDGYAARYGLTHRRILILRDDGGELRGEDLLVPTGKKGKRGKVGFAIRFHLGPGIEAGASEDGKGVGLALPDGSYWQFRAGDGEVIIEDSLWIDGKARPVPTQQIVVQGLVSRGGGNFGWLFKKMG